MRWLPLMLGIATMASAVNAQNPSPSAPVATTAPTSACAMPEFRQFDFWKGEWDVTSQGKPAGRSRVETILDGCALLENWRGASGTEGKSFNTYNTSTKRWEQYWVDGTGAPLHLSGGLVDGKMVLEGTRLTPNANTGAMQHERITWTPNADGSVRQFWETSTDEGKSWTISFDGLYRKAAIANPSHT
jgi:hypothetical protein